MIPFTAFQSNQGLHAYFYKLYCILTNQLSITIYCYNQTPKFIGTFARAQVRYFAIQIIILLSNLNICGFTNRFPVIMFVGERAHDRDEQIATMSSFNPKFVSWIQVSIDSDPRRENILSLCRSLLIHTQSPGPFEQGNNCATLFRLMNAHPFQISKTLSFSSGPSAFGSTLFNQMDKIEKK